MLKKALCLSFGAGVMVSIGGAVFLGCDNRTVGAVLFSVALLSVCYLGLFLYTGRIGYVVFEHDKNELLTLLVTLCGNLLGALFSGFLIGVARPGTIQAAATLCGNKLAETPLQALLLGFFCGVLMYAAVEIYKSKASSVGILFCIPVFILAGFEHSIADMFYLFCARDFSGVAFGFMALVVLGNSLGAMLLPGLKKLSMGKTDAEN